jgi:hypothetical protein
MRKFVGLLMLVMKACILIVALLLLGTAARANTIVLGGYGGSVINNVGLNCEPSCLAITPKYRIEIIPTESTWELSDEQATTDPSGSGASIGGRSHAYTYLAYTLTQKAGLPHDIDYNLGESVGAGNTLVTDMKYIVLANVNHYGRYYYLINDSVEELNILVDGPDWYSAQTFGPSVSAVPLPAAAWLFISAIAGLAGAKRLSGSKSNA